MTLRSFLRTFRSAPAASQEDPWNLNVDPGKLKTPSRNAPSRANSPSNGLPSIRKGAPVTPRASNNPPVPHSVFMDAINFRFDKLTPQDTARVREVNTLTKVLKSRVASMEKLPVASGNAKFSLKAITGIEGHAKEKRTQKEIELHILLESQWRFAAGKLGTLPEGFTGLPEGFAIGPDDLKNSQKARKAKAKVKSTPPDLLTPDPVQENRFDHKATRHAYNCVLRDDYCKELIDPIPAKEPNENRGIVGNSSARPGSQQQPTQTVNEDPAVLKARGKAKTDVELAKIRKAACSEQWGNWLRNNKIQVVPSSKDQNNCLLVSLLQHATGQYGPDALDGHEHDARQLRADVPEKHKDIEVGAELTPDSNVVKWAIKKINKDKLRKLRLITIHPVELSETKAVPIIDSDSEPDDGKDDWEPVVVLGDGAHYQAIKRAPALERLPESTT